MVKMKEEITIGLRPMEYISYDEYMNVNLTRKSKILGKGIYKGYEWIILSYLTHPCAYIVAKKNDVIYNKKYSSIDFIDVHGGLTYSDWGINNHISHYSWVIGWDYAHYGDYLPYDITDGKKWTTEEIYENIKDAINDIIKESEKND